MVWGVVLVLAAGAVALYFTDAPRQERRFGRGGPVPVQVEAVFMAEFADTIEAVGTALANESIILTARVSETVSRVNFDDGDVVEKGQVLVELTSFEERAQLQESRAALTEAESQFERAKDLVRRGNASQATLDLRTRELEEARSRIKAAEARVADRVLRAPFSGILGLRRVSKGSLVSPGDEITTLDDISIIKLDFSVPETFLAALAPGQTLVASAPAYPNRGFEGEVKTVNTRVDPITRAVSIRAELPNPDGLLKPGMLMTVSLVSNQRRGMAVSENALVPVGGEQYVYVVRDGQTAERIKVEIGGRRPGLVEVVVGLEPGQQVIVSGTLRLTPGAPVRVTSAGADAVAARGAASGGS
ncbi:MAG: efflux RND transporter periplasmic adaptor subunit [Sphingomonadales bacterium]|nr:efflux RND transporter periplasmic adaptor subunit [Sphingomonadales bacterium]